MPRDQGDLFGYAPPRRPVVAAVPAPRPAAVVRTPGPPVVPEGRGVSVAGVTIDIGDVERNLNHLWRGVTGPLAYKHTLGQGAYDLAVAAMPFDHLRAKAIRVKEAYEAQEKSLIIRKPIY